MSKLSDIARNFTISGVIDENTRTQNEYPVRKIPVADIAEHPDNIAYSMEEDGIRALADSIAKDGITDLPLVRKMPDGSFQMLSGHRRKAAFALLAQEDSAYASIPCRIIEGISDAQASTILHSANYFTRHLNVTERAAATKALGIEVDRLREENPELKGERSEDIKAAILSAQTGKAVSGKSIQRDERIARLIEESLEQSWQHLARFEEIPKTSIEILAGLPGETQRELWAAWKDAFRRDPKLKLTKWLRSRIAANDPDPRLTKAEKMLRSWMKERGSGPSEADLEVLGRISLLSRR
ncbi:MAG: ParB/RepB/Spo0J family partition protein [Bacteroidales bacterium]|nr:ParB/RepB/Spo0J family partition protein [Bacteroidales bacterium]